MLVTNSGRWCAAFVGGADEGRHGKSPEGDRRRRVLVTNSGRWCAAFVGMADERRHCKSLGPIGTRGTKESGDFVGRADEGRHSLGTVNVF